MTETTKHIPVSMMMIQHHPSSAVEMLMLMLMLMLKEGMTWNWSLNWDQSKSKSWSKDRNSDRNKKIIKITINEFYGDERFISRQSQRRGEEWDQYETAGDQYSISCFWFLLMLIWEMLLLVMSFLRTMVSQHDNANVEAV